jgi:hypothetical protein
MWRSGIEGYALRPWGSSGESAGDRIGRFKLLQQIGEGSCGVVFMRAVVRGLCVQGPVTIPGYEHVIIDVVTSVSSRSISYPSSIQDAEGGTLLKVIESGFDKVSPDRRLEASVMNTNGWEAQLRNIDRYSTSQGQMLPKPTPNLASAFFALGDRTRVQLIAVFAQAQSCPRADGGSSDLRNRSVRKMQTFESAKYNGRVHRRMRGALWR